MKALLFAAALALSFVGAAEAHVVRHPATGSPAIIVDLPDDWTQSVDADKNLVISSANKAVAFSITVATEDRSADIIARESLQLAGAQSIAPQGPGVISPYAGSLFTATMAASGMTINLRCTVVKPDASHFVAVTLVANPAASAVSQGEAALLFSRLKIVQ